MQRARSLQITDLGVRQEDWTYPPAKQQGLEQSSTSYTKEKPSLQVPPQQLRQVTVAIWAEGQHPPIACPQQFPLNYNRTQASHAGENPGASGSGDQGELNYRAPQNSFFIRSLFLRPGEIAAYQVCIKQTQRVRQNE